MTCERCEGSGFLNIHQLPNALHECWDVNFVLVWIKDNPTGHDVCVCDCCGDNEDWYGNPGEHFTGGDHIGRYGPYAYNGVLSECY